MYNYVVVSKLKQNIMHQAFVTTAPPPPHTPMGKDHTPMGKDGG